MQITQYIQELQKVGRYSFSYEELSSKMDKSNQALRSGLKRLIQKQSIYNVRKGFYIIIPPEYSNMGILPIEFYIDHLMNYLNKKYYVGLLSASMLHGAAHQQPQIFQVITQAPNLRPIQKSKINIQFSKRNEFPTHGIMQKKTETGSILVSTPELTFLDLIYFEHSIGGFSKITTILQELSEEIKVNQFKTVLQNHYPIPVFQRAGYIAEHILKNNKIAAMIEQRLLKESTRTILLKTTGKKTGKINEKWKIIINTKIESDL